jgi:hypothetical protein
MRLAQGSTEGAKGRGSPYRVAGEVSAEEDRGEGTRARAEAWALVFILGSSLLRFVLFAFRSERFGLDPALALALALGSAYTLYALSRDSKR